MTASGRADFSTVAAFLSGSELTLNIAAGGSVPTISWAAWADGGSLSSTTNLTPPVVWSPVTNAVESNGSGFSVTLPIGAGERFFRLTPP